MPSTETTWYVVVIMIMYQIFLEIVDDDEEDELMTDDKYNPWQHMQIGNVAARDIYNDIINTGFFYSWANCPRAMFDYIRNGMAERLSQPRNIDFLYTDAQNALRRRRPCKVSLDNRVLHLLHTFGEGNKVWKAAAQNGWNISSVSKDFRWALICFVKEFGDWISDLTPAQRAAQQGLISDDYPTVVKILDGSMYRRRKTTHLPPGINRKDYYDHKRNWAEAINVQACVTHNGMCCELLTGSPRRQGDAKASRYICLNDPPQSVFTDEGFPGSRSAFVRSNGTREHKQQRVPVEWYFGHNKMDWQLTGSMYRRSSLFHNLAIRASFILSNMKKNTTNKC